MPSRVRYLVEVPEEENKKFEDVFLNDSRFKQVSLKKKIGILIYILETSPVDFSIFCRKMDILKNGGSRIDYRIMPY